VGLAIVTTLATTLGPAPAQRRGEEPTPERVNNAIDKAVSYLKAQQRNGNWEHRGIAHYPGGVSCLTLLSLLEAGVDPRDKVVQDGIRYIRNLQSNDTYVVALQTMVLSKAFPKDDQVLIKKNVDWLLAKAHRVNGLMAGWGYPEKIAGRSDNSNTQYAVLALWFASQAGVRVEPKIWNEIRDYYVASQLKSGGWSYFGINEGDERLTMTSAGVCGLLIADMELARDKAQRDKQMNQSGCGENPRNEPLERGLARLGQQFTIDWPGWRYYHMYGIERAGRLSGLRFFSNNRLLVNEGHDWYRAGARFLLNNQRIEGYWADTSNDGQPVIATSFAVLFLCKGRTPVLFHKLMHGLPPNQRKYVGDWNRARNDIRNLTEFCSLNVFKKGGRPVPLTWQIFDASKQPVSDDVVKDLLQAPIAYFNGTQRPEFTNGEQIVLQRFVEQGGFLVAEALQGKHEFAEGFRQLARKLWPEHELRPIEEGHAIWSAAYPVPPGSFKLEGIDFGCKLSVILIHDDLACFWEGNQHEGLLTQKSVQAFCMGANLVAYATGLEPPDYKLAKKELTTNKEDQIVRGALHVAQINYGGPDWQPAPRAMRNVMEHVNKTHNIDVILQTKPLTLRDPNLTNHKFLYMHGRREFTVSPEEQKLLRQHLEGGGLLLADACCGSESFDKSFGEFVGATFGRPLVEIPPDDPFFEGRYGKEIKSVQCRTERGKDYQNMTPQLRGLRLDPTNPTSPWMVIYSKYDLGCALQKHQSTACLGHNYESALDLAAQAVLYALKE
jgi:hypothetical protein